MEKKLRDYTRFIEGAVGKGGKELAGYHREMVANFQHERLVHLIIMLFFVGLSLVGIGASAVIWVFYPTYQIFLTPMIVATGLLVIITGFYVKHYYVLENGVQNLYKFCEKLYEK